MKKIMFTAVAATICIVSCSKKNDNDQLQKSGSNLLRTFMIVPHHGPAKKETRPIVILKPVRPNGTPLPSFISLVNGTDVLNGQTSALSPEWSIELTKSGNWEVHISSSGYVPILETVDYEDSLVYQVDTMQLIP